MIKKITKYREPKMKHAGKNRAKQRGRLFGLLLFVFAATLLCSCAKTAPYEQTNYVMGSVMRQTLYGADGEAAAEKGYSAAADTEARISWKIPSSEISRLNENAGKAAVELSDETGRLLSEALELSRRSGGAFDPAILPLSALWDFDSNPEHAPEREKIEAVLPLVSAEYLELSEHSAALSKEGCGIDLGAVGKGAACDAAVAAYRELGVRAAVVSVGGSIGVFGKKPDGSDFKIAVRDPAGDLSETLGYLTVPGETFVSTSGDYEKYFIENGVKYSHILDPETGYPVKSEVVSATVAAKSGALSDMLSTACFALGAEKSRALLEEYGAGAVFVYPNGEILVIGGLDFTLTGEGYRVNQP